ncbi:MAG: fibronectin type III domain-containing protein, partial [Anaerolineales bacterium]
GHKFKSWSNSTYSQTNPFTIIMDNDRMIDANFNLPAAPGIPSLLSPANNLLVTDYTPRLDWANASLPSGTFFGHYEIEIDNNSDFSSREVIAATIEGDITKSDFTPEEELSSNTKYYWRVRSYNSAGVSGAWSASRYFRTAMLPPELVEPLDTAPIDNKRPMLQWAEVEGAGSYTVEAALSQSFATRVFSVTVSSTSYTRTADLLPNKLYYWRVRANGLNGPSLYSEVHSFTTGNPPSIPVLSAPASNVLVTNYSPLLDWSSVTVPAGTGFKYYRVQTATNSAFTTDLMEYITVEGLVGESSLNPIPSLAPNRRFYWRVRAENTDGQSSAWSASRYFRTALTPPASLTPGSVIPEPAVPIYSRHPTFRWEPAPDAAGYTVEYSTAQTFATKISVSTTKTSLTPAADLLANKVYYWRVKATGTNGPSAPSQVRTFMTGNPPTTPVLSSPATGTLLSSPVLLNWANSTVPAGTSFDHYQIQVATDNAFDNIMHDNSLPGLSNSQDNTAPLAAGTTYYWRVCAWNIVNGTESHSSAWSAVRSVRIKYDPPTLEVPENAATAISRLPTFDWNDTTGATSYTLQVSTSPSFGTLVINRTLTSSTYTHLTSLLANKTYYWRVRINGSHGPSNWSPFLTFTTTP